MDNLIEKLDEQRRKENCLTITELLSITDNTIYDPLSTIISKNVVLGKNNIIYPNTIIMTENNSTIKIGNNNLISSSTKIIANNNNAISIGSNCRIDGSVSIYGNTNIENGSQILGFIQVYDCILKGGKDFNEKDPNLRGGVLKGVGRAKKLTVKQGHVINGVGDFKQDQEELQINYHPIKK